jgi:hypothetical protein
MFQLGLLGLIYSLHSLHGDAARQATPQASVSATARAAVLLLFFLLLHIRFFLSGILSGGFIADRRV